MCWLSFQVRLFATPWTAAYQAPPSMGFSRQEYWSGLPFPSPGESSQPRDRTQVSHIAGRCFNLWATREALSVYRKMQKSGLTESIAFVCNSAIWSQYSVFSHPEFPWASPWGVAALSWLLDGRYYFPFWVSSRLTGIYWRVAIADACDILIYWDGRKYAISQYNRVPVSNKME